MTPSTLLSRRRALNLASALAVLPFLPSKLAIAQTAPPSLENLYLINDDRFQHFALQPAAVLYAQIVAAKPVTALLQKSQLPPSFFKGEPTIPDGRGTPWVPPPPAPLGGRINLREGSAPDPSSVPPVNPDFVERLAVGIMAAGIGSVNAFSGTINRAGASDRIASLASGTDGLIESDNAHRVMVRGCSTPDGASILGQYLVGESANWGAQLAAHLSKPTTMNDLLLRWNANNAVGMRFMRFSLYKALVLNSTRAAETVRVWQDAGGPLRDAAARSRDYPPNWYGLSGPQQSTHPIVRYLSAEASRIAGEATDWSEDVFITRMSGAGYPVAERCTRRGKTYGPRLQAFVSQSVAAHGLATGAGPNNRTTTADC